MYNIGLRCVEAWRLLSVGGFLARMFVNHTTTHTIFVSKYICYSCCLSFTNIGIKIIRVPNSDIRALCYLKYGLLRSKQKRLWTKWQLFRLFQEICYIWFRRSGFRSWESAKNRNTEQETVRGRVGIWIRELRTIGDVIHVTTSRE